MKHFAAFALVLAGCHFPGAPSVIMESVCGYGSPARAPRCVRAGVQTCGTLRPGWPQNSVYPGDSESTFPVETISPRGPSNQLFHDVTILGDRGFVAYNSGIEVRTATRGGLAHPGPPYRQRDIFTAGDWLEGEVAGENDYYLDQIAGAEAGPSVLIAASGRQGIGTSLWKLGPRPSEILVQLYQDDSAVGRSRSTALHKQAGRWYAIACGLTGCRVYDVTAAKDTPGCLETSGACFGVYVGEVAGSATVFAAAKQQAAKAAEGGSDGIEDAAAAVISGALTADTTEHGGCIILAAGTSYSAELWQICDLSNPAGATRLHGGLASEDARAVAVWSTEGDQNGADRDLERAAVYLRPLEPPPGRRVGRAGHKARREDHLAGILALETMDVAEDLGGERIPGAPPERSAVCCGSLVDTAWPGAPERGRAGSVRSAKRDADPRGRSSVVVGRLYLATVEWSPGVRLMRIYDATHCPPAGCSSLGAPAAEVDLSGDPASVLDLLTYSRVGDVELLCYGMESNGATHGLGRSRCWRVDALPALVEIGNEAGTYSGDCAAGPVDYSGQLQPGNVHGANNYRARVGRLAEVGGRLILYRAAWGLLHADVYTPPAVDPALIFADGFESGGTERWAE